MLRSLIVHFFPSLSARIEAESRRWMVRCIRRNHRQSVWETEGMRYEASGTVRRYGRCDNRRQSNMLRIYLSERDGTDS